MNVITFPNSLYRLHQPFVPVGDQPAAIAQLVEGAATEFKVPGSNKTAN